MRGATCEILLILRRPARSGVRSILQRVAPVLFVLLWSSSFIAAKVGLRHLSPLLFVAVRLSACAGVLSVTMLVGWRSWRPLRRGRWVHCAIAGVLLNAIGLMAPHVSMLQVPAAQIALVQSLTPLLTAALGIVVLRETLQLRQWIGLLAGVAGVGLVVGHAALDSPARFGGLVLAFIGVLGLVGGTLYFGRFCRGIPPLQNATVQFLAAALFAVGGAWWLETPRAEWTSDCIAAVTWNTLLVSLSGMALYFYMLAKGSAARASANFYLVPGTAALLAWLFLGERPTVLAITGLLIASAGCWLVSTGQKRAA